MYEEDYREPPDGQNDHAYKGGEGEERPVLLSQRQLDIVIALGRGKTNKEIAGIILMSEKTVEGELKEICKLLNVKRRSAIVGEAWRTKILNEGNC